MLPPAQSWQQVLDHESLSPGECPNNKALQSDSLWPSCVFYTRWNSCKRMDCTPYNLVGLNVSVPYPQLWGSRQQEGHCLLRPWVFFWLDVG